MRVVSCGEVLNVVWHHCRGQSYNDCSLFPNLFCYPFRGNDFKVIVVQGEERHRSFAFTHVCVSVEGDLHSWAGGAGRGFADECVCHASCSCAFMFAVARIRSMSYIE